MHLTYLCILQHHVVNQSKIQPYFGARLRKSMVELISCLNSKPIISILFQSKCNATLDLKGSAPIFSVITIIRVCTWSE